MRNRWSPGGSSRGGILRTTARHGPAGTTAGRPPPPGTHRPGTGTGWLMNLDPTPPSCCCRWCRCHHRRWQMCRPLTGQIPSTRGAQPGHRRCRAHPPWGSPRTGGGHVLRTGHQGMMCTAGCLAAAPSLAGTPCTPACPQGWAPAQPGTRCRRCRWTRTRRSTGRTSREWGRELSRHHTRCKLLRQRH